jgi:hypothetical protein
MQLLIKIEIRRRKKAKPSDLVREAAVLLPVIRSAMQARRLTARGKGRSADASSRRNAADFVADFLGRDRRTLAKAAAVVEAAAKDPARYGDLLAEMDRTYRIDPAYRRLMSRANACGESP